MRSFTPLAPTYLCGAVTCLIGVKKEFRDPIGQSLIRLSNTHWYQKVIRKRLELTLSLFVLRVVTDYSDYALSLNNLALFAHRLNRRPNFHRYSFPAW